MKSGFHEPNAIKKQKPKDEPKDDKTSMAWDFRCPQYDQRSSCFVNAGTHYGVGHRQPVGSKSHNNTGHVPSGRINTMEVEKIG